MGGWNCDKNGKSRDAFVILDAALQIVGKPWRGNLRTTINVATGSEAFIHALVALCGAPVGLALEAEATQPPAPRVTLAIDTPRGFSQAFMGLVTGLQCVEPVAQSSSNPYLFRRTERFLCEHGLTPLSAVKDMIGSQATKGMHVLAKFAPQIESCGVWTDGHGFRVIETYPTACRKTPAVLTRLTGCESLGHDDKDDARVCAVVASLFAKDRSCLENPPPDVPDREGWIWVPKPA